MKNKNTLHIIQNTTYCVWGDHLDHLDHTDDLDL